LGKTVVSIIKTMGQEFTPEPPYIHIIWKISISRKSLIRGYWSFRVMLKKLCTLQIFHSPRGNFHKGRIKNRYFSLSHITPRWFQQLLGQPVACEIHFFQNIYSSHTHVILEV